MSKVEVSVISGEESRFLKWTEEDGGWVPCSDHNHRRQVEKSTLLKSDFALREKCDLHEIAITNDQLSTMSPAQQLALGARP